MYRTHSSTHLYQHISLEAHVFYFVFILLISFILEKNKIIFIEWDSLLNIEKT